MSACLVQVCMHIYRLNAIYCNVVIGLMHIMEGVLVIYILSTCNTCYNHPLHFVSQMQSTALQDQSLTVSDNHETTTSSLDQNEADIPVLEE